MGVPPDHVITAIEEAQRLRGWIANAYAQIEYLMGDIIMESMQISEYAELNGRLPHGAPKRITRVRKILAIEGHFSKFCEEIESIIYEFEKYHEIRNLLAHGFCTIFHTPDSDVGFEYRKWHRSDDCDTEIVRMFRIVELDYHKNQLVHVSERALGLSREIHGDLGLIG